MKNPFKAVNVGKNAEVVYTHNALEAGQGLHTTSDEAALQVQGSVEVPKPYHVFGLNLYPYRHPRVQTAMLGFVIFLTVGMYHVITAMGGAGQQTATLADGANITLYTVFTVFCFVSPACLNYFGMRATLCFGAVGYAAYASSLWCYNRTGNEGFVYFGGAWNGLSAAFLWTADRTGISAYATEDKKGLYVSIFWTVFQVGTVVGSAIPVGQNWNAGVGNKSTVSDGTYIGLFILMITGACVALLLYPMTKMVREDGTRVTLPAQLTWLEQLRASWQVLKDHKYIMWMWPYAWAINYYSIYQNNRYNSPVFTVRGRALNTLMSGIAQIFSAWVMLIMTDKLPLNRRHRAYVGLAFVWLLVNGVNIGGYFAMVETKFGLKESQKLDVYTPGYGPKAFLYVMYGFMDGCYNTFGLWFIGALSNDRRELSVYFSMFTFWQSACTVCAYALDFRGVSHQFMFGSSWGFLAFGPLCLLPIIKWYMKETNIIKAADLALDGQDMATDPTATAVKETAFVKE
ncbi:hypothetical protein A1O3_05248 [Capronia epimyces CBS 606.96]|uniref:Uncharacterized protein n=1 Tax=Capronia epimyces CBS 606.96 TaxID=1182542 RepID=W9XWH0_9EURO|nr:uncharacterized protein A1O3_05248 [Capronia epimyces CBS 606.96]EXJ84578.1 hypothetical protein A1O3_05248 [Capronia epimyces CBS 606.96]